MEGFVMVASDLHIPLLHELGAVCQQQPFTELKIQQFIVT
jgi:hypothetical protein